MQELCSSMKCLSTYSSMHSSCFVRISLGFIRSSTLQSWSCSQQFSHFLASWEIPVLWCAFWQWAEDVCHTLVPFTDDRVLGRRNAKVDPMIRQVSQFWWWLCWKIVETLLCLWPKNMFLNVWVHFFLKKKTGKLTFWMPLVIAQVMFFSSLNNKNV